MKGQPADILNNVPRQAGRGGIIQIRASSILSSIGILNVNGGDSFARLACGGGANAGNCGYQTVATGGGGQISLSTTSALPYSNGDFSITMTAFGGAGLNYWWNGRNSVESARLQESCVARCRGGSGTAHTYRCAIVRLVVGRRIVRGPRDACGACF